MKIIKKSALRELTADKLITVGAFVDELKPNNPTVSSAAIHYHLNNTDLLDWCDVSGVIMIIKNTKYKNFKPGENYGGKKRIVRTTLRA